MHLRLDLSIYVPVAANESAILKRLIKDGVTGDVTCSLCPVPVKPDPRFKLTRDYSSTPITRFGSTEGHFSERNISIQRRTVKLGRRSFMCTLMFGSERGISLNLWIC